MQVTEKSQTRDASSGSGVPPKAVPPNPIKEGSTKGSPTKVSTTCTYSFSFLNDERPRTLYQSPRSNVLSSTSPSSSHHPNSLISPTLSSPIALEQTHFHIIFGRVREAVESYDFGWYCRGRMQKVGLLKLVTQYEPDSAEVER